jgi:hypothetical protein
MFIPQIDWPNVLFHQYYIPRSTNPDRLDYGNKCSRRKEKSGVDVIGQELESID